MGALRPQAVTEGIVTDWDAAESILEHTYKSCLSVNAGDHPLHLAEANHNPSANREKMAEICFEKLGVPALFLSKCAVLTAFCVGARTALVLDIGGGVTSATAVHDGYVLRKSVKRHALAGDRISEMVCKSSSSARPRRPYCRCTRSSGRRLAGRVHVELCRLPGHPSDLPQVPPSQLV